MEIILQSIFPALEEVLKDQRVVINRGLVTNQSLTVALNEIQYDDPKLKWIATRYNLVSSWLVGKCPLRVFLISSRVEKFSS